jgi:hypothetical protein
MKARMHRVIGAAAALAILMGGMSLLGVSTASATPGSQTVTFTVSSTTVTCHTVTTTNTTPLTTCTVGAGTGTGFGSTAFAIAGVRLSEAQAGTYPGGSISAAVGSHCVITFDSTLAVTHTGTTYATGLFPLTTTHVTYTSCPLIKPLIQHKEGSITIHV